MIKKPFRVSKTKKETPPVSVLLLILVSCLQNQYSVHYQTPSEPHRTKGKKMFLKNIAILILLIGLFCVNANENENLSQQTCTAENIKNSQLQFNSCAGVGLSCQQCRATLISQDWAITAAKCVHWYKPGEVNKGVEISGLTDMNENKFQLCQKF